MSADSGRERIAGRRGSKSIPRSRAHRTTVAPGATKRAVSEAAVAKATLGGTGGPGRRLEEQIRATTERFKRRESERKEAPAGLKGASLLAANPPERVRLRLARLGIPSPAIDRAPTLAPTEVAGVVVRGTAEPAFTALERVLGRNDLTSVSFLERGLRVSRSVARVRIRDDRGVLEGFGTGFLVSPRLLLTNNHVLHDAAAAASSEVEFNYQSGLDGAALPSEVFQLAPDDFFLTDKALDFTLVAVKERSLARGPLSTYTWNRLIEAQGKLLMGEYVNIIQHPNGEPKQLALRENEVIDIFERFLHYQTDTAPGSSGSPVFNDQWEVVGLHHSGVPRKDKQGQILTPDGQPWTPDMGPHRIAWIANEGVRISTILQAVRAAQLSGTAERLRAQLLDPAAHETVPGTPLVPADGASLRVQEPPEAPVASDGGLSWTLPLQLSVRLERQGAQLRPQVALADSAAPARARLPPRLMPAPREDATLREALALLEDARSLPYYDEEEDAAARERYYRDIDAEASDLFQGLQELVSETHRTLLRYQPSLHVYPWVDLQENRLLRSVYSGKDLDPEELIREDFRIGQERTARLREALATEAALGPEGLESALEALEASLPYNCEHVVPQSWFAKREPMRGDLHHLFACESACNSFRGNIPYFDFADFEEAVREGCGKRVSNKFEPTAGKGVVARATLYFLLRYPGEINRTSTEYEENRLATLLRWHEEHPVSLYERHRNAAIFRKQGNRNPLIDHPDWAEGIDFSAGLG